jgi:hypothetical protein
MKLISEKRFQLYYILVDYIDYCFGCFLLQQPKSKIKQQLCRACAGGLAQNDNALDILDIETRVRGYIISENDVYLDTFNNAVIAMNSNLSLCQS